MAFEKSMVVKERDSVPSPYGRRRSQWVFLGVVLLIVLVCGWLGSAHYFSRFDPQVRYVRTPQSAPTPSVALDPFGIDTLLYWPETVPIAPGSQFYTLLTQQGIPDWRAQQVVQAFDSVFPIRRIRALNSLRFYRDREEGAVCYGVYRHTPRHYVLFDICDSVRCRVAEGELPVHRELWAARVEIQTSLWNAMRDAECRPELALNLSDIMAWSVDFFGLSQGDQFHVVYEREFIEDREVGIGRIYTVRYITGRDTVEAFSFPQDSVITYWNRQAQSVRKEFLKAPLRFSRISSGFSTGRLHPVLKIVRPHSGIDYAAPEGTPVVALGDGTVIGKGFERGGGNYVKIRHNSTYTTGYLHLSRFGQGIEQGVRVSQGQVIGYVGHTGLATGPHLDFRVWRGGVPINPLRLESPPVAPLDSSQLQQFADTVRHQDSLLSILLQPGQRDGSPTNDSVVRQLHLRIGSGRRDSILSH